MICTYPKRLCRSKLDKCYIASVCINILFFIFFIVYENDSYCIYVYVGYIGK